MFKLTSVYTLTSFNGGFLSRNFGMNIVAFVMMGVIVCSFNCGRTSASCVKRFEEETNLLHVSLDRLTEIINDYTLRVVKSSLDKTPKNWFIFPMNVISTLSALYLGSNHSFSDEFETMLRITDEDNIHIAFQHYWKRWNELNTPYDFDTLDMILFNKKELSLSKKYKEDMNKYYHDIMLEPVDFPKGMHDINKGIAELTKHIKEAVSKDMVTPKTLLLIISAANLNAQWDVGFPITETKKFYLQNKGNKSISHESLFTSSYFNYKRDKETQCDVVQLTMDDVSLSMFLVVPIKGKKIMEFRNAMESDRLKTWINTAGFQKTKINLWMPKGSPRKVLPMKTMIVESLFDQKEKDLSKMFKDNKRLSADQYLQVGYTDFTNDGKVGNAIPDPDALSIAAVVPFVYFVVDMKTKMIILAGKYTNPQS